MDGVWYSGVWYAGAWRRQRCMYMITGKGNDASQISMACEPWIDTGVT